MRLKGEVSKIYFRNEENGYTVLDILSDGGDYITAVGIFPPIVIGESIEAEGDFKENGNWGLQFYTEKVSLLAPTKLESIKRYLSSGLIKGLGKVTAAAIIDRFGQRALEAMTNPKELSKVKGISLKKAEDFCARYKKMKDAQFAVLFLSELGVTLNLALKIYKTYGENTERVVKNNPYVLVEDIEGVGFKTADKIAEKLGIKGDSDKRICAGIIHIIKEYILRTGNTCIYLEDLVKETEKLLNLSSSEPRLRILSNIDDLVLFGQLRQLSIEGASIIMLSKHYIMEKRIAEKLCALKLSVPRLSPDVAGEIERFEKEKSIALHESQKKAVETAVLGSVTVITGGPGTGKTTIVKCILSAFLNTRQTVALCAPTGRAAKRLSEATGHEAKTIHRLLELDFRNGQGVFTYGEQKKLEVDAVIVDEVSMVDEFVFSSLLKALKCGTRLILVGDRDQLPSVGPGNVLSDIINSRQFTVIELSHIYRQAEGSGIVMAAHKINKGQLPSLDNKSSDFFFEEKQTAAEIRDCAISLCTSRLPKYLGIAAGEVQLLCPMKKGLAGAVNLNREMQKVLNPKKSGEKELCYGENIYRIGDKVMQISNNYQQTWYIETPSGIERGAGVFNGDIGILESIEYDEGRFTVRFEDGRVAEYSTTDLEQLAPAYAVTIHKSQGSEFEAVVVTLDANYLLQSRNLIYTAVTRAKSLVVLVGTKEMLQRMIRKSQAQRLTLLTRFITEEFAKTGGDLA